VLLETYLEISSTFGAFSFVNLNLFYAWRKIQVALQEVDFLGWI
jgi:hypothetical protein